ncbi:hypothetical protein JCM30204_36200 [Dysgonomonas termitidis]
MIRIFITAIVLYLIFLACYLVWERSVKRKRNAAKRPAFNPFKASPKEDIIGKSGFDLRHSLPQATTLIKSDKREENTPTFAPGNAGRENPETPATIPPSELDKVFSSGGTDDSGEIDLSFNDEPEGSASDGYEDNVDSEESGEAGEPAGAGMATGVNFDDLSGMVKTVENPEAASSEQREEAGRVLAEVRQTDMFEQAVSGEPKKKATAGKLMDDYFAAYHRRKREAGETNDEPGVKAPKDFDPRAFA